MIDHIQLRSGIWVSTPLGFAFLPPAVNDGAEVVRLRRRVAGAEAAGSRGSLSSPGSTPDETQKFVLPLAIQYSSAM